MLQKTDYNEITKSLMNHKLETYQYFKNVVTLKHVLPTTP